MLRIFLVDDDRSYRALLRTVLHGSYEIVGEAADAYECIAGVRASEPDVVLLDMNMPGMSGLEALPRIREEVPEAKIVALSTASPLEYERHFTEGGGFAYIEKPHDVLALNDHLRLALEGIAARALEIVEEMVRLDRTGQRERIYSMYADDIRFTPFFGGGRTLEGVEAIRSYVSSLPASTRAGTTEVAQILASGDRVVVLGVAMIDHPESGVRRFPLGSVITIREDKVSALANFSSWQAAKEAAGLGADTPPEAKRTFNVPRLLFAVRGPRPALGF